MSDIVAIELIVAFVLGLSYFLRNWTPYPVVPVPDDDVEAWENRDLARGFIKACFCAVVAVTTLALYFALRPLVIHHENARPALYSWRRDPAAIGWFPVGIAFLLAMLIAYVPFLLGLALVLGRRGFARYGYRVMRALQVAESRSWPVLVLGTALFLLVMIPAELSSYTDFHDDGIAVRRPRGPVGVQFHRYEDVTEVAKQLLPRGVGNGPEYHIFFRGGGWWRSGDFGEMPERSDYHEAVIAFVCQKSGKPLQVIERLNQLESERPKDKPPPSGGR